MRALLLCASSVVRDLRVTNSKKRDAEVQFQRHPLRLHSTCVRGFQQVWVWSSRFVHITITICRSLPLCIFTVTGYFLQEHAEVHSRGKGTPMSSISHFMTRGPCTGVFSSRKRGDDGSQATFTDLPNRDYHASPGTIRGTCISRSPDAEGAGSRPALMLNCRAQ